MRSNTVSCQQLQFESCLLLFFWICSSFLGMFFEAGTGTVCWQSNSCVKFFEKGLKHYLVFLPRLSSDIYPCHVSFPFLPANHRPCHFAGYLRSKLCFKFIFSLEFCLLIFNETINISEFQFEFLFLSIQEKKIIYATSKGVGSLLPYLDIRPMLHYTFISDLWY